MTAEAPLLGGCACGAARYALSAPPLFVHACWCEECRRLTGGAFAHNLLIEADRVRLTAGEIRDVPAPGASGMPQRIFRCTACATALWSLYGGREAIRFVRGGTLDDPSAAPPDVHVFARSAPAWLSPPPGVRRFDAFYDREAEWPAQSLARRRAALAVHGETG